MKRGIVLCYGRGRKPNDSQHPSLEERLRAQGADVVAYPTQATDDIVRHVRAAKLELVVLAATDQSELDAVAESILDQGRIDPLNLHVAPSAIVALAERSTDPDACLAGFLLGVLEASPDSRRLPTRHRWTSHAPGSAALSRRRIFTLFRRPVHHLVPAVDDAKCAAGRGCSACRQACPVGGVQIFHNVASIDPSACVRCGLCVSTCPAGAISFPHQDEAAATGQVRSALASRPVILAGSLEAFNAILPVMAKPLPERPVAPLLVPCAGALPPRLLLHMLRRGAAGIVLIACPKDSHCGAAGAARATASIQSARRLLSAVGADPARVQLVELASEEGDPWGTLRSAIAAVPLPSAPPMADDGDPERPLSLAREATKWVAASPAVVPRESVPGLGVARVDASKCTLCGLCTVYCPTGALTHASEAGHDRLRFDAARCVGCDLCVPACPEKALGVEHVLDAGLLRSGPVTLAEPLSASCELCGQRIGSLKLRDRIRNSLGQTSAAWERTLARCPDCRLKKGLGAAA